MDDTDPNKAPEPNQNPVPPTPETAQEPKSDEPVAPTNAELDKRLKEVERRTGI